MSTCPFCLVEPARVVASSETAIAIRDAYPITEGHTLVLPRTAAWLRRTALPGAVPEHSGIPYFTMKECGQWKGPFAAWKQDPSLRDHFSRLLAESLMKTCGKDLKAICTE